MSARFDDRKFVLRCKQGALARLFAEDQILLVLPYCCSLESGESRLMHSPRSLRTLKHSRSRSLTNPSKIILGSNQYSTYLQTTTKPDYHSSTAASVTNGSPSNLATQTPFSSPLGKASYVQQMWFHGGSHKARVSTGRCTSVAFQVTILIFVRGTE